LREYKYISEKFFGKIYQNMEIAVNANYVLKSLNNNYLPTIKHTANNMYCQCLKTAKSLMEKFRRNGNYQT